MPVWWDFYSGMTMALWLSDASKPDMLVVELLLKAITQSDKFQIMNTFQKSLTYSQLINEKPLTS